MKSSTIFQVIIALLVITLGGCAPLKVPTEYEVRRPAAATPIPLRVGLNLPPQFKKFVFRGNQGQGQPMLIPIGEAMAAGAERAMREVFVDVVMLGDGTTAGTAKGVQAVATPEIVEADNRALGFPSRWESRVACKWTIKAPDGKLLYVNTITGEGPYEAFTTAFTFGDHLGRSMVPAMRDHYQKLVSHLLSTRWWDALPAAPGQ